MTDYIILYITEFAFKKMLLTLVINIRYYYKKHR